MLDNRNYTELIFVLCAHVDFLRYIDSFNIYNMYYGFI